MNEHEAIAHMKRGDIKALEFLVRKYQVKAVRVAWLITQDRKLAEDVVQAAFIRVYQRIDQFDSQRTFAPWFMRSVVNAAVKASQKLSRQISLDDKVNGDISWADLLADPAPEPGELAERADLQEAVQNALQQLSPEQRAVIVMRYYLEMSENEMSELLDAPPGTVKWRLHAARKQLRVLLQRFREPSGEWRAWL